MEYFLPIAQVEINILFIFGLSLAVGILSGLFGVGGGFLMTPFLIFLGIPPAYAVPNEASNILGTSVSGSTTHYLKGTLDYKMGLMIVVGGTIGTLLGILTFSYFQDIGKINIVISLAYMYILAILGTLMLIQGVSEIDKARKKIIVRKKLHTHYWIHGLPFRMRFKKSKVYESAFTPIIIGLIVGYIASIDNTWGTPYLIKPLDLGFDMSIVSATKYYSGHSDVMGGSLAIKKRLFKQVELSQKAVGLRLSPDDAYLIMRGLRTLDIRLDKHQENTIKVANFLSKQKKVKEVFYPIKKNIKQYKMWKKYYSGSSGLMGVKIISKNKNSVIKFLNKLKLFAHGYSWGGFESLALYQDKLALGNRSYTKLSNNEHIIRLHIGLEDPNDLIADIKQAIKSVR